MANADRRRIEEANTRPDRGAVSHRWRFWKSDAGTPVIANEIDALPDEDALSVQARMIIVRNEGLSAARHLVEDIYEVEAHGIDRSYRLIFTSEGEKGRILLAKTPKKVIALAKQRRDTWRARGSPSDTR